jgi:hypothetical protein
MLESLISLRKSGFLFDKANTISVASSYLFTGVKLDSKRGLPSEQSTTTMCCGAATGLERAIAGITCFAAPCATSCKCCGPISCSPQVRGRTALQYIKGCRNRPRRSVPVSQLPQWRSCPTSRSYGSASQSGAPDFRSAQGTGRRSRARALTLLIG